MKQVGLELSLTWKGWGSRAGSPRRRAVRERIEAAQYKTYKPVGHGDTEISCCYYLPQLTLELECLSFKLPNLPTECS